MFFWPSIKLDLEYVLTSLSFQFILNYLGFNLRRVSTKDEQQRQSQTTADYFVNVLSGDWTEPDISLA